MANHNPLSLNSNSNFSYIGEVDDMGRPHGFGTYKDFNRDSEVLCGNWVNGIPTAPYTSRYLFIYL